MCDSVSVFTFVLTWLYFSLNVVMINDVFSCLVTLVEPLCEYKVKQVANVRINVLMFGRLWAYS